MGVSSGVLLLQGIGTLRYANEMGRELEYVAYSSLVLRGVVRITTMPGPRTVKRNVGGPPSV